MAVTETVRVGNSGDIAIPVGLQNLAGIRAGSVVTIEAGHGGLVIRSTADEEGPAMHHQPIASSGPLPNWFQDVVAKLNGLSALAANWDSYGAKRIEGSSIRAAAELLLRIAGPQTPAPAIVPTNQGTVILEWHTRGVDLEIEVFNADRQHVAFEDAQQGNAWELDVSADLSQLVDAINRLSVA